MINFHFIRPYFLLAFIPLIILLVLIFRKKKSYLLMGGLISPHLLNHLILETSGKKGNAPVFLYVAITTLSILSLAGPTYTKEPSPFAEDEASLVILMEVTESMLAQDIQPSRLQRASQKISDLQKLRKGSKTALIAYAGSSHVVMPVTEDSQIISTFAAELTPDIMPKKGHNLRESLIESEKLLNRYNGSILLITDGVNSKDISELQDFSISYPIIIYHVAAPPGQIVPLESPQVISSDKSKLRKIASLLSADIVQITPGKEDVENLNSRISRSMKASMRKGGNRWRESGFWLVPIIALLTLCWFRKGWRIRYE